MTIRFGSSGEQALGVGICSNSIRDFGSHSGVISRRLPGDNDFVGMALADPEAELTEAKRSLRGVQKRFVQTGVSSV